MLTDGYAAWIVALGFAALVLVGYTYVGYPMVLWLVGRMRRRTEPFGFEPDAWPTVSIILPVYNEEQAIERKLRNTLDQDYPVGRAEIHVVSDGSRDRTESLAAKFADRGVRLHVLRERSGKAAALNLGLRHANGEIVVFTDATIELESSALRALVARFADPRIGCVSGEDFIPGGGGEGAYGRYELMLRNLESAVHSIVGASGCFYGQRRALCAPFEHGMAPDFLSVLSVVDQGYRAVTEPTARGVMRAVPSIGHEFQRKVRTVLRGITTLVARRRMLDPTRSGVFALELWSHKLLRWLVPAFLLVTLACTAALWRMPLFRALLTAQVVLYVAALVGWLAADSFGTRAVFRIPFFFCLVNIASLVAWVKFASGDRLEIWEPSRR
jgi:hypothetical protein